MAYDIFCVSGTWVVIFNLQGSVEFPFIHYSVILLDLIFADCNIDSCRILQGHANGVIAMIAGELKGTPNGLNETTVLVKSLSSPVLIGRLLSLVPNLPVRNIEFHFVHADSNPSTRIYFYSYSLGVPYFWYSVTT